MALSAHQIEDADTLTVPVELDAMRLLWMLRGGVHEDPQLLR